MPMTFAPEHSHQNTEYPALENLAAIGDGRSLALVDHTATINWFCPARFDTPALFWKLLDSARGGYFRVGPKGVKPSSVSYVKDTAVVAFQWKTGEAKVTAKLAMVWPPIDEKQTLIWHIKAESGTAEIQAQAALCENFGRNANLCQIKHNRVLLKTEHYQLLLQADQAWHHEHDHPENDNRIISSIQLEQGQTASFCLTVSSKAEALEGVTLSSTKNQIAKTEDAWRQWCKEINYQGRYPAAVVRSAICLKLLIYQPTGAVVAAGTTSLPETIGGVRNWDYRYTWFRDAGFTLSALSSLVSKQDAHKWARWMQNAICENGLPLDVMYTVTGEQLDEEHCLDIEGYRGSRPVREGNAAKDQLQMDMYGVLMDCVYICDSMDDDVMRQHWSHLRLIADFICDNWREPGSGIWEVRGEPRHFVHSKVAAWCGLQRALWMANRHDLDGDRTRWHTEAESIKKEVFQKGVSADRACFKRAYDDPTPDASLLLLPRMGFIDGDDPVFCNTVDAVWEQCGVGGTNSPLIRRYKNHQSDGVAGTEGAFLICSFWLVDALVRTGREDRARKVFEELLKLQGRCGLLSEQAAPEDRSLLGNIPQAFSHVGLINAALMLDGIS